MKTKLIFPSNCCINEKVLRGRYMSSVISHMPKAKCVTCGAREFAPQVFDKTLKISIYLCKTCGGHPEYLRIRRYLPIGIDGQAERVDILWSRVGERITSVDEAKHIARSLSYDLRDGRFDPNDYRPKSMTVSFVFKNLMANKYIPFCENKFGKGDFETKQVMINHLIKFFGEYDLRKIKAADIKEYYLIYKCGDRSKDLSIQELRVILNFFKDLDIIKQIPTLPKTKQSKEKNVANFLTKEEQQKVLSEIDDELYRAMIETLTIYAMRPGDVRGLQWRDVNFQERTLTIRRHFSKSRLKSGRKSTEEDLVLPLIGRFIEILGQFPQSINGEDFIFQRKDGGGAVGEARMRIHWNKANKKARVKKVTLYEGTKHCTLTPMKNEGHLDEDLRLLTGHTTVKTLKRYAKETNENKLKKINKILEKESEKVLEFNQ